MKHHVTEGVSSVFNSERDGGIDEREYACYQPGCLNSFRIFAEVRSQSLMQEGMRGALQSLVLHSPW
jgi:hypothetical protein